jgi:mono/diheme cytochrome c family protein
LRPVIPARILSSPHFEPNYHRSFKSRRVGHACSIEAGHWGPTGPGRALQILVFLGRLAGSHIAYTMVMIAEKFYRRMLLETGGLALALVLAGPIASSFAQDPVEAGQKTFMDSGCHGCHIVDKMGTPIGPELSHVGTKYSKDYLRRWLRDPSAQRPSAHMPAFELTDEQVRALANYLSSLR